MNQVPEPGSLYLDHVAHFVPDLGAAADLLEALGFAVTPVSAQVTQDGPAGTSNRCVMLDQGYLEFLAPTHDTPNAQRLHDAMARYAGVHLACFGTPAAEAEHARLADHGFDPLPLVHLQREVDVDGEARTARFVALRAAPERMPEGRIQFVQHLTPECLWQPRYLRHTNGVTGLAAVFVVAREPVQVAARFAHFAALLPRPAGGLVRIASERGSVLLGTAAAWTEWLGDSPAAPALAGYALACRDPKIAASLCERAGLGVREVRKGLFCVVLPQVLGGAWLLGEPAALGGVFGTDAGR